MKEKAKVLAVRAGGGKYLAMERLLDRVLELSGEQGVRPFVTRLRQRGYSYRQIQAVLAEVSGVTVDAMWIRNHVVRWENEAPEEGAEETLPCL